MWTFAATDPLLVAGFSAVCSAALLALAWGLSQFVKVLRNDVLMGRRLDEHDEDIEDHEHRLRTLEQRR